MLRKLRSIMHPMVTRYGERIGETVMGLTQYPEGARLQELADALDAPLSSAQRAIGSLLPRISRRALAKLAADHGLARVVVFGSSARQDFRPDSDVDVMIEPMSGTRPRLSPI